MIDEAMLLRECAYNLSGQDPQETKAVMQAAASKIDELRAALQERDAEIDQWKVDFHEVMLDRKEQRKVLEQALNAFKETMSMYLEWHKDFPEHVGDKEEPVVQLAKEAITAIQEQLK